MVETAARGLLVSLAIFLFMGVMLVLMSAMTMMMVVPLEASESRGLLLPLAALTFALRKLLVPLAFPGTRKLPVASWLAVWASLRRITYAWRNGEHRKEKAGGLEQASKWARLVSTPLGQLRRYVEQSHSILPNAGADL
jgi:hypothetical protein